MQELTRAQEEVLKILWELKEGVVADVIACMSDPKPAYNTVSTVIKVLERKGYVSYKAYGKTHVYFPVVSRKDYAQYVMKDNLKSFFNGSVKQAVSFFVKGKDASVSELEELKQLIEQEIQNQKRNS